MPHWAPQGKSDGFAACGRGELQTSGHTCVQRQSRYVRGTLAAGRILPPDTMEGPIMPVRLKKLIGTVIIVALVVLYALIATTIASYRLAESAWYVHMLYFLFTGILWIVPAMFVIRWMERPPKHRQS
ncbi:DUF2842 domain-containing protein [Hoeflea sp.]|nr:DUF2842 domain-containing protein [Hoeflea sp.]